LGRSRLFHFLEQAGRAIVDYIITDDQISSAISNSSNGRAQTRIGKLANETTNLPIGSSSLATWCTKEGEGFSILI